MGCSTQNSEVKPPPNQKNTIKGVDLSFLPQINSYNPRLSDQGTTDDMLTLLMARGINTVRLRLWHSPNSSLSSFDEVSQFSREIKAQGLRLWLSVHYADSWADPGNQKLPQAWNNLNFTQLKDSVYRYTQRVMTLQPDIIQVGNEINNGFLFPLGNRSKLANFTSLLQTATAAIRAESTTTKIMLHYAGYTGSLAFYNEMSAVDYDMIGLSYYPLWHGKSLETLASTLSTLSAVNKPMVIAETSYPFTLAWQDQTHNVIGQEDQLILPTYPASPEGQFAFMQDLKTISTSLPLAFGFCYWGGEWIAYKGPNSTVGSTWENQALFDFEGNGLKVLDVFGK